MAPRSVRLDTRTLTSGRKNKVLSVQLQIACSQKALFKENLHGKKHRNVVTAVRLLEQLVMRRKNSLSAKYLLSCCRETRRALGEEEPRRCKTGSGVKHPAW